MDEGDSPPAVLPSFSLTLAEEQDRGALVLALGNDVQHAQPPHGGSIPLIGSVLAGHPDLAAAGFLLLPGESPPSPLPPPSPPSPTPPPSPPSPPRSHSAQLLSRPRRTQHVLQL